MAGFSKDKNNIYNQYLKSDFTVGVDNLNPKRELVKDDLTNLESLKNLLFAYYRNRIASLKGVDPAILGRRGFSGEDVGDDAYFDSTSRAIALGIGQRAAGEPNDGDVATSGLDTDLAAIKEALLAQSTSLLELEGAKDIFIPPDNPVDLPESEDDTDVDDGDDPPGTVVSQLPPARPDPPTQPLINPIGEELDRLKEVVDKLLGGDPVTLDDLPFDLCTDRSVDPGDLETTGLSDEGQDQEEWRTPADIEEDAAEEQNDVEGEHACTSTLKELLEQISAFIEIVNGIVAFEQQVLAYVYPIVQQVQKIVAIWLNPAMTAELVQDLVGAATAMGIEFLTEQVRKFIESLNLSCFIEGTQDAIRDLFGVIAGVGDAADAVGVAMEFNKKWVDEAALAIDDPDSQMKRLLGIEEGSDEEAYWDNGAAGGAEAVADHLGGVFPGAVNGFFETIGIRTNNGEDLIGYKPRPDGQINSGELNTSGINPWQSVLASPIGPAVQGVVNTGLGLVSVTRDTWEDLSDVTKQSVELGTSVVNLGGAAVDAGGAFLDAGAIGGAGADEVLANRYSQKKLSRKAAIERVNERAAQAIDNFFFFYETQS